MGKVNSASKRIMAGMASVEPSMPEMPKEATVRQADNGGYIVRVSGGKLDSYPGKEKVYDDLEGVGACLGEHFGVKKEG